MAHHINIYKQNKIKNRQNEIENIGNIKTQKLHKNMRKKK